MKINKNTVVGAAVITFLMALASSGSHPTSGSAGYTGAPGDSSCGQCHTGGNGSFDGEVIISGLPTTIMTGDTYTITVTVTNPNGNAVRGGFQLLALTGTNTNAGSMTETDPFAEIKTVFGGKKYFGHSPAQNFPVSNEISFSVDWTAPASTGSNPNIKFYASAVIANNGDGNQNDLVVLTNQIIPIMGNNTMPLVVTLNNVQNVTCANLSNGSATASPTGGITPYLYAWNNGSNVASPTNLPSGLAVVTVTDNAGTTSTASTNISAPPTITASAFGSVVCVGATNGTASVSASGGSGGFTYNWTNGGTNAIISNLSAANYTVTVTDINSCSTTRVATVSTSPNMVLTGNQTNISCNGGMNGSATVIVNGGSNPISYSWTNGSVSSTISNLTAGSYTVTVTDAVLCTKTSTFTITQPLVLSATFSNINNVTCNGGNNGSATVTFSGGTPIYSYQWSNGATGTGISSTQNNLIAGTYMITVTDLFDCQKISSVTITQPIGLTIQVTNQQNVTCNGLANGTLTVGTGGTIGSPVYAWSNGFSTNTISNLSVGSYTVTVTDNGTGCSKASSYSISQPTLLTSNVSSIMNVSCNGGSNGGATITGVGGNGAYAYIWSNGGTSSTKTNLAAGTYTITVTDSQSCTTSGNVTITQPLPIAINLMNNTPAACIGVNNGALSVSSSNGSNPYQYLWNNGLTSSSILNLAAGIYTVTTTDVNNCTASNSFTVGTNASFNLSQNTVTNVTCNGTASGAASIVPSPGFTYLWSNGSTAASILNVTAGMYTVTGTNQAGCQSIPLSINITQPGEIISSILQSDTILCFGEPNNGSLSLQLSGGTGVLNYVWSNNTTTLDLNGLGTGSYTISITDSNNCPKNYTYHVINAPLINIDEAQLDSIICFGESNGQISLTTSGGVGNLMYHWSNNENDDTISNLSAGIYQLTITDQNGCLKLDTFNVEQPDSLEFIINIVDESESGMNDGMITVTPIGGTSPFNILWSNGESDFAIDSLAPGLYTFQILDSNDCSSSGFGVVGGGNCALSATYELVNPTCFNTYDGEINLNISGDFEDYDIQLFSGSELLHYPLDSVPAGTYSIIIQDSMMCLSIIPNILINSVHPPINLDNLIIVQPTSSISKDGSLNALISGGEGNLNYLWTKNGVNIGTTASITNLMTGTYVLQVTDNAGCKLTTPNILLQAPNGTHEEVVSNVHIAPNPVTDILYIKNNTNFNVVKIAIFNLQGQNIYQEQNTNIEYINTNHIPGGLYYVQINIGEFVIAKKILISE
ncbi:MAG: T9SS type A sorting domain-containing protein [Saprospiraceae bacterium]|nr:T9SS type A sorting domain-containing protein [Saprospiraceae bacterium]